LADVGAAKDLDPASFVGLLNAMARLPAGAPVVDANTMALTALADLIEQTHHRYLQTEPSALVEKADHVAAKHGWRDLRLLSVAETIRALAANMFLPMEKEQQILFLLVRELERSGVMSGHGGSIANPIRQMEHEHDGAGAAAARLRELADGFTPDAAVCNTHRAMLAGFAALVADLHQPVHKENEVLFPWALALEAQAVA